MHQPIIVDLMCSWLHEYRTNISDNRAEKDKLLV